MILFEAEGVVALLLFGFWIWALFDCIATDAVLCRNLPKGVWLIIVLLLFDIGALTWLLLGRPGKAHWRPGSTDYTAPRRPIALEDEPRYHAITEVTERRSAELDAQLAQWEAEKRTSGDNADESEPDANLDAWEADLSRREKALRRRELELRRRELDERERGRDHT